MSRKFCEHSSIEEVENVHSNIKRSMIVAELFTPISVIRLLMRVDRKKPYRVLQMTKSKFLDFKIARASLNFHGIPFSKVKHLRYEGIECQIAFKTDLSHAFKRASITQLMRLRKCVILSNAYGLPVSKQLSYKSGCSEITGKIYSLC